VKDALHAEWTKLRTVTGPAWLLAAAVISTVALGVGVAAAQSLPGTTRGLDTTKISLTGIDLGQAVVAVLGIVVMSAEYSHGMIRVTLTALPRRFTVLTAKAMVIMGVTVPAAALCVLGSLVIGSAVLADHGLTPARGYRAVSLTDATVLRAAVGAVLYLALIALLSFAIASIVRDSAVAIGIVTGLLYLFPIVAGVVSDPAWSRHLQQIGPMTAGLTITATTDLRPLPLSPWAGLGVLAAWAVGALAMSGLLFRMRDP
jgi:ABC-2 type transport system permease protein